VILFGDDAKRVIAFDESSQSVDLMTFDDDTSSFVFQEVTFSDSTGHPRTIVSEANPSRCRACHGTPARPVWDTYPVWPGAFGETTAEPSSSERGELDRFAVLQPSHPRYRYLLPQRRSTTLAAERRYLGQGELSSNVEIGVLLARLNARAIASELRRSPDFEAQKYALLSALVPRCWDSNADPTFAAFAAETRQANARQREAKRQRAQVALPIPEAEDGGMTRLRFIAERELGLSTRSWTLALEKGSYDFASSRRPALGFERDLFAAIGGSDERLANLFWHSNDTSQVCAYLREHDQEARRARAPAAAPVGQVTASGAKSLATVRGLLAECAACHEAGAGPSIPFLDQDALAARLTQRAGSHGSLLDEIRFRLTPEAGPARMPLNRVLSDESRADIMAYLSERARSN
jgi:mono/diheme cytochrome c family protein